VDLPCVPGGGMGFALKPAETSVGAPRRANRDSSRFERCWAVHADPVVAVGRIDPVLERIAFVTRELEAAQAK
jgi:hypothetical protein